jgi:protoporphyrinogen oxidase
MEIAIIGAGISGLSSARLLVEKGHSVTLLEAAEKPGGLIKCDIVSGGLFHLVGGHIFNTRIGRVAEWFWSHFDREKEFIKADRNARILMDGHMMGYPIENHLYELDPEVLKRIIHELMLLEGRGYRAPFSYRNFEEFLVGNFGETLYQIYFKPYNRKIWRKDISEISMDWLEGKLPMPDYREIILKNMLREGETEMVHSTFYYPRSGGSQFIADRLAMGLNIRFGIRVEAIEASGQGVRINGNAYDALIYTGDIRLLNKLLLVEDAELSAGLESVRSLPSNGTSNLFCETDDTDVSWLYIPGAPSRAHRIIYTGNFSPENNPPGGRTTCTVEFSGKVSGAQMEKEIRDLPGNLKALDMHYEPSSYVIQTAGVREQIARIRSQLAKHRIYPVGRFAEWEYYNMDKAIESAMNSTTVMTRIL